MTSSNGTVLEGTFKDDYLNGKGEKTTHDQGLKYVIEGTFENDEAHGKCKLKCFEAGTKNVLCSYKGSFIKDEPTVGIMTTPKGSYEGNFTSDGKVVYTNKEGVKKDEIWVEEGFVPAQEDDEQEKHA